ncbi:VOC family protein [Candidatus Poribacteria bacterium]|jgi:catechol 2,3-dioxygenase-like lactoylglutathione lyase family enzyme|nr:VOC family protein [Candidatus Poribacteria bacterium]MBT5533151.1 VOC family protein [Candidatus Poribacteria bacterium]MBT5713860.1 VOC family protein [Candidatus Poribacteria bacterium]MBT7095807.1 VOC family protein [Candidatus Poribacteria bacterium]MBT7806421.1 VOC family protein [Candidatus Poribacteria bacterium]
MARLRHIALRCADAEASRRFYELLGFSFVDYRPDGLSIDLSDGALNMTLLPHAGERPRLEEGEEYIHFGIIVPDAAELWQRLRDAGATVLRDDVKLRNVVAQEDAPAGSYKVADPDGNVIDVTDNLDEWRWVE